MRRHIALIRIINMTAIIIIAVIIIAIITITSIMVGLGAEQISRNAGCPEQAHSESADTVRDWFGRRGSRTDGRGKLF